MSEAKPDYSSDDARFELGQTIFQYMRVRLHLDQLADPDIRMGVSIPPLVPFETVAASYLDKIGAMSAAEFRTAIASALDYCGRDGRFPRCYADYAVELEAMRRPRLVC